MVSELALSLTDMYPSSYWIQHGRVLGRALEGSQRISLFIAVKRELAEGEVGFGKGSHSGWLVLRVD